VRFVAGVPKTSSGKIRRAELPALFAGAAAGGKPQ
jgi:acyl-coenzyme A synthetase/AMP-(fatty) acid ligase